MSKVAARGGVARRGRGVAPQVACARRHKEHMLLAKEAGMKTTRWGGVAFPQQEPNLPPILPPSIKSRSPDPTASAAPRASRAAQRALSTMGGESGSSEPALTPPRRRSCASTPHCPSSSSYEMGSSGHAMTAGIQRTQEEGRCDRNHARPHPRQAPGSGERVTSCCRSHIRTSMGNGGRLGEQISE